MARSQYYVDPSRKHVESFEDFSGGLNTTSSNDTLLDSELPNLVNIDLGDRGSLKRRTGIRLVQDIDVSDGLAQGFFRYYHSENNFDTILIYDGEFYVNGEKMQVGDGSIEIQKERPMEAVQYKDKLYIASGSKLLFYDGEKIDVVEPYVPDTLEALYVGTNALADNPTDFMRDRIAPIIRIDGVTFDQRYGVVNEFITMTAWVSKPQDVELEYRFERRLSTDREWFISQDWTELKTHTFSTTFAGDVMFRVRVRRKLEEEDTLEEPPEEENDEEEEEEDENENLLRYDAEYIVPKFIVKPARDPEDEEVPPNTIHTCNRILLHWDRLIIYGDVSQEDAIFISDLGNPAYFPTPNSLRFENTRKEPLQALVKFRDVLVAFTTSTIQALFGKSPLDYRRIMLNPEMGTVAPFSPKVVENAIIFLSKEGIYALRNVGTSETRFNVTRLDEKIASEVDVNATNACSEVFDNQYHIVFPDMNKRLRFYYLHAVWAKDESPKMDFANIQYMGTQLYGQGKNGNLYVFDNTVYDDDGYIYEDVIEFKYYGFREPFKEKKLKQVLLAFADYKDPIKVNIECFMDNRKVLDTNETIDAKNSEPYKVNEIAALSHKLRVFGKGQKIKVIIKHKESKHNHVLGLGFIFKLKHP